MKVYQIARKVDGFGNDMCTILNEVYLDKNMAKDKAKALLNQTYIENLMEIREDLDERIEKAKRGIRISYNNDDYNLTWNNLHRDIVTSYEEMNKIHYGDFFIIELEVKEVSD